MQAIKSCLIRFGQLLMTQQFTASPPPPLFIVLLKQSLTHQSEEKGELFQEGRLQPTQRPESIKALLI